MSIGKVCDVSPKGDLGGKTFMEKLLAYFQSTIIPSSRFMLAQEILLEISLLVA